MTQKTGRAYKRTILLVDRNFQLRYCLYVCSWVFGLSLAFPLIIQSVFNFFLSYLASDPYGPALGAIQEIRGKVLGLLIVLQLAFLAITFVLSLFISHRIAGPLYKLRRYFAEAAAGRLVPDLKFRKGDHFIEIADGYNAMMSGILARRAEERSQIASHIDKALAGANPQARAELEQALARLQS